MKSILITGASSGIGRELALLMAREGWALAITARRAAALEAVAQACMSSGASVALSLPADLTDGPAECERVVRSAAASLGGLDALACVAGVVARRSLSEMSDPEVRQCFSVNLEATLFLTRAAWPHLIRNPARTPAGSCVVAVSSMASVDPFPGLGAYAAAKAGVNLLMKAAAEEGRPDRVRAYAVAPGAVETPMLRGLVDAAALPPERCLSPRAVAEVLRDCILGRREEATGSVIFLPSP